MPRYIIDERTPCKSDHGFASDRRQARRAHAVEGGGGWECAPPPPLFSAWIVAQVDCAWRGLPGRDSRWLIVSQRCMGGSLDNVRFCRPCRAPHFPALHELTLLSALLILLILNSDDDERVPLVRME